MRKSLQERLAENKALLYRLQDDWKRLKDRRISDSIKSSLYTRIKETEACIGSLEKDIEKEESKKKREEEKKKAAEKETVTA